MGIDSIIPLNDLAEGDIPLSPIVTQKGVLSTSFRHFRERFGIYNNGAAPQYFKNEHLHFKDGTYPELMADMFSSHMAYQVAGGHVVLAGKYIGLIEIYDDQSQTFRTILCPEGSLTVDFDKEKSQDKGVLMKNSHTERKYLQVVTSEDRIYALYSGKQKGSSSSSDYSYSNRVFVLDLKGEPVEILELESDTPSIAVDSADLHLYAIHNRPEPTLVRYDLQ